MSPGGPYACDGNTTEASITNLLNDFEAVLEGCHGGMWPPGGCIVCDGHVDEMSLQVCQQIERGMWRRGSKGVQVSFPALSEDQAFLQLFRGESFAVSPSECICIWVYQLQQVIMFRESVRARRLGSHWRKSKEWRGSWRGSDGGHVVGDLEGLRTGHDAIKRKIQNRRRPGLVETGGIGGPRVSPWRGDSSSSSTGAWRR